MLIPRCGNIWPLCYGKTSKVIILEVVESLPVLSAAKNTAPGNFRPAPGPKAALNASSKSGDVGAILV